MACPGRSYTVVAGDTLVRIAQRFLGDGTRWGELTKPDGTSFTEAEAENLQIGQVVCIPGQSVSTPGKISVQDVHFTRYSGGGDINAWIAQACQAAGLPHTQAWVKGFQTLCQRESSYDPNAVNTTDSNAYGPIVADGHPQNCSRGVAQCIPPTFAAYHVAGTSVAIYDPVANIAAASRYIRDRYRVSLDGSDFAAKVQQADPSRPPHGY